MARFKFMHLFTSSVLPFFAMIHRTLASVGVGLHRQAAERKAVLEALMAFFSSLNCRVSNGLELIEVRECREVNEFIALLQAA